MTKSKLWHTLLMVGGALAVLAPDLTSLAATLTGLGVGWLSWVARGLGILALIGSRWDKIRAKVEPIFKPSSNTPVICALILGSLLLAGSARAADSQLGFCEGRWCVQPATAVGWAVIPRTGELLNANVLAGVSVVRDGGIPLGFGFYGGSLLSPDRALPTLAALFSVANFGAAGPGVVMFKDAGQVDYWVTLNLSLNLNYGSSPTRAPLKP